MLLVANVFLVVIKNSITFLFDQRKRDSKQHSDSHSASKQVRSSLSSDYGQGRLRVDQFGGRGGGGSQVPTSFITMSQSYNIYSTFQYTELVVSQLVSV